MCLSSYKYFISVLFCLVIFFVSCSEEKPETIEEKLIGTWEYKREALNVGANDLDDDQNGTITFHPDETGDWTSLNQENFNTSFEWDLLDNDLRISISKELYHITSSNIETKVYELEGNGNFNLKYEVYNVTGFNSNILEYEYIDLRKI